MMTIDDILDIRTEAAFERAALDIFAFQARACAPYREYLGALGIDPGEVRQIGDIPFLPIGLFKSHRVYCGPGEPEQVFTSSSTTGMTPARHYVASLALYEKTFRRAFGMFYGGMPVFALLPSYLEREGSSLVYMADALIRSNGGGFYLRDTDRLIADMERAEGPRILLGVSYALLDLAEGPAPKLRDTVVMETGGMKGRREEMPKEEMHRVLCRGLGVERIHSEYGMAELMSQAYSDGGGEFVCPPWMRVVVRDANDPFARLAPGASGGIDIIDLANLYSCAFIQTQDLGQVVAFREGNDPQERPSAPGEDKRRPDSDRARAAAGETRTDTAGNASPDAGFAIGRAALEANLPAGRLPGGQRFRILGRLDGSEIRGCNLLVQ